MYIYTSLPLSTREETDIRNWLMQIWTFSNPQICRLGQESGSWEEPSYSSSSVGMSYATASFLMVSAPTEMFFLLPVIQILFILQGTPNMIF